MKKVELLRFPAELPLAESAASQWIGRLTRIFHRGMGSTGDPPVPSGDPPPGTEKSGKHAVGVTLSKVTPISSGQWPDDTGQWPVPPRTYEICGLRDAGHEQGPFHVALSGGRIAAALFSSVTRLAQSRPELFDGVHFFWADKRCVPPTDPGWPDPPRAGFANAFDHVDFFRRGPVSPLVLRETETGMGDQS